MKDVGEWFVLGDEFDGERVDAVAGVFVCHVFSGKDMTEVSSTISTLDFCPYPIRIGDSFDCIGKVFIK